MPVNPTRPPTPKRTTVAGSRSETKAIDSPNASRKMIGVAQDSWSRMKSRHAAAN
jgi:hypothetical protein